MNSVLISLITIWWIIKLIFKNNVQLAFWHSTPIFQNRKWSVTYLFLSGGWRLNHPKPGAPEDAVRHDAPLLLSPHFMLWALTPKPLAMSVESMLFSPRLGQSPFSDSQPRVFPIASLNPSLNWGCIENPKALHAWPYWLGEVFFLFLPFEAVNEQTHLPMNHKGTQAPTYST